MARHSNSNIRGRQVSAWHYIKAPSSPAPEASVGQRRDHGSPSEACTEAPRRCNAKSTAGPSSALLILYSRNRFCSRPGPGRARTRGWQWWIWQQSSQAMQARPKRLQTDCSQRLWPFPMSTNLLWGFPRLWLWLWLWLPALPYRSPTGPFSLTVHKLMASEFCSARAGIAK